MLHEYEKRRIFERCDHDIRLMRFKSTDEKSMKPKSSDEKVDGNGNSQPREEWVVPSFPADASYLPLHG